MNTSNYCTNVNKNMEVDELMYALAIGIPTVGYSIGIFAGRTVAWMRQGLGIKAKTDSEDKHLPTCLKDPVDTLPIDVTRIVFKNLKKDLPHLASVCKNWKALVDDNTFRQMIRPSQTFGTQEWKEYIGVDAGEEIPLPLWSYEFMENGNYMLTFIPKFVKVTHDDGTINDIAMDNLEVIGGLTASPKNGNKIGYDQNSWQSALKEKRKLEESHWVFIRKELVIGDDNTSDDQKLLKKERLKNAKVIDTFISVFMEYVRSGNSLSNWNTLSKGYTTWVTFEDVTCKYPLAGAYVPSSIHLGSLWNGDGVHGDRWAVVGSRTFFAQKTKAYWQIGNWFIPNIFW